MNIKLRSSIINHYIHSFITIIHSSIIIHYSFITFIYSFITILHSSNTFLHLLITILYSIISCFNLLLFSTHQSLLFIHFINIHNTIFNIIYYSKLLKIVAIWIHNLALSKLSFIFFEYRPFI